MKITHERRAALLEVFSDALRLTDDQERRPSDEKNEQTGWFSDEMCDADNVIRDLLDWVRDAEEYLDQRADVDDGRTERCDAAARPICTKCSRRGCRHDPPQSDHRQSSPQVRAGRVPVLRLRA